MENRRFETGDAIVHEHYGKGKIIKNADLFYTIDFGKRGIIDISKRSEDLLKSDISHQEEGESGMEDLIEKKLIRILEKYQGISETVSMGDKWSGGKMILQPENLQLKPKEIPVETFFHKIVMVRDRLRVLEQQINAHQKLSDEDKVNMQQYITRIYGSLTTFNVLFKEPEDYFKGEKSDS
jgi:hypothetical protein